MEGQRHFVLLAPLSHASEGLGVLRRRDDQIHGFQGPGQRVAVREIDGDEPMAESGGRGIPPPVQEDRLETGLPGEVGDLHALEGTSCDADDRSSALLSSASPTTLH